MNPFHLEFCASPEWRATVQETILPVALRDVDLGPRALEIGPGPGFTTDVLRTKTDHLTAVEVDPDLASALATRTAGSNVDVRVGDARKLDFPDHHFTGAASFHMLHHIEPDRAQDEVFAELARVVERGGTVVAADGVENEATRAFHVDDVYNPIDPEDLDRRLRAAGFSEIEIRLYDLGWLCTART
jgi:SAM-dependent methyltransferase